MNDRFRSGKRQAGLGLITLIFVGVIIVGLLIIWLAPETKDKPLPE